MLSPALRGGTARAYSTVRMGPGPRIATISITPVLHAGYLSMGWISIAPSRTPRPLRSVGCTHTPGRGGATSPFRPSVSDPERRTRSEERFAEDALPCRHHQKSMYGEPNAGGRRGSRGWCCAQVRTRERAGAWEDGATTRRLEG